MTKTGNFISSQRKASAFFWPFSDDESIWTVEKPSDFSIIKFMRKRLRVRE